MNNTFIPDKMYAFYAKAFGITEAEALSIITRVSQLAIKIEEARKIEAEMSTPEVVNRVLKYFTGAKRDAAIFHLGVVTMIGWNQGLDIKEAKMTEIPEGELINAKNFHEEVVSKPKEEVKEEKKQNGKK